MPGAARPMTALIGLTTAALTLAACSGNSPAKENASVSIVPQRILRAPGSLAAVTQPQENGVMWMLAGKSSMGLFEMDSSNGSLKGSVSVSGAARAVAESSSGVIGLGLGTARSGALQLLSGSTGKISRTVPLPAPARQVAVGSDGSTFYVLTGTATTASVTIIGPRGHVTGTVPMPSDAVSVVPDPQQTTLYALERNGLVDQINITGHKVVSKFMATSKNETGESMAISPDGSTLYVLKTDGAASNIAEVNLSTESVRKVLPAPSHCVQVLVSAGGGQLYEVVGTATYGNIQVYAA